MAKIDLNKQAQEIIEAALKEYMTDADRRKIVTPMKRSILVFLRGNQRLAKDDFEKYSFDWF